MENDEILQKYYNIAKLIFDNFNDLKVKLQNISSSLEYKQKINYLALIEDLFKQHAKNQYN